MSKILLVLIFFSSFYFISTIQTSPNIEAFISKDAFLQEVNYEISKALINQNFPNNISSLYNNTIDTKLNITNINLTILDISVGNQSTFVSQTMFFDISSLNFDFSLTYISQMVGKSNAKGVFTLNGCNLTLDYVPMNGTGILGVYTSVVDIDNFNISFDDPSYETEHLQKLIQANDFQILSSCKNLISSEINTYFQLNTNSSLSRFTLNNVTLYYALNLTNVSFSSDGLKFKAIYSIFDDDGVTNIPIPSTEVVTYSRMTESIYHGFLSKCPKINAKNMKIPLKFFQDMTLIAHNKHFFNYSFNESDGIPLQGFSFYTGDLAFAMPSISDSFYPDTRVDVFCGSNDNSPPTTQLNGTPVLMEIAYRINCSIRIRPNSDDDRDDDDVDTELLTFDTYLHTYLNIFMGRGNAGLSFSVNSIQKDGDIIYHDDYYKITVKKGKDILTSWIQNALDYFKKLSAPIGELTLPIDQYDIHNINYVNGNLLVCEDSTQPCFSDGSS